MSQSQPMKEYVPLHILAVPQTDVGRTRDHNEDVVGIAIPGGPVHLHSNEGLIELPAVGDAAVLRAKGALFLVSDGMGGYQAGEVASDLAARTIIHEYYADPDENVADSLRRAVIKANAAVHAWGQASAQRKGMGTTAVVAVVRGAETHIAWVGDSRVYLLRNGALTQSTDDHSFVWEQVKAGILTKEAARNHPQKNVVTRALGHRPEVEVDSRAAQLQPGDLLLLCSDGLSGPVDDPQLEAILKQYPPEEAVARLIQAANAGGGPDNISVLLLTAHPYGGAGPMVEARRPAALSAAPQTAPPPVPTAPPPTPPPTAPPPTGGLSPLLKGGMVVAALIVLAALVFGVWQLLSPPANGVNPTATTAAPTTADPTAAAPAGSATATLAALTSPEPTSTLSPIKPTSTVQPPTPTPEPTPTPAVTPTPKCERRAPELVSPAVDATHISGTTVRYAWQGGQLCPGDQWRVSLSGNGRQEQLLAGGNSSVEWALNLEPGTYTWLVDMVDETGAVTPGKSSGTRQIHFQAPPVGQPTPESPVPESPPACASLDGDGDGVNDCDDKCPEEAAPGTPDGCRPPQE